MLDIAATVRGRKTALGALEEIRRKVGIPILMGGGLKMEEDAAAFLDAGADRVAINTAAVRDPDIIARLARRFGRQCVVLAIDAAAREGGGWTVRTQAGRRETGIDAVRWAERGAALGAGEILLTSIDRDGTGSGYDLELVAAVVGASGIPVIASGGAGAGKAGLGHFAEAARAGARAVLAAGVFHRGELTIGEVKNGLASEGIGVRS
jgi:cyclase